MPNITYEPFYPQWEDSPLPPPNEEAVGVTDNGDGTFTMSSIALGDGQTGTTPITAAALKHFDDGLIAVVGQANTAASSAVGAQGYSDAKVLVGVAATQTANFTAEAAKLNPVDATAAAITVTLPAATEPTAGAGTNVGVIKTDASANLVTVTGTINGIPSTTYHLNVNEGVELLSDGAGSWWLRSSQGADLSGLATQAALNTTNGNVSTNTTNIASVTAQQTTLLETVVTIDEQQQGWHLHGAWISDVWTEKVSASHERALWVAPFDLTVVACEVVSDFTTIAASGANYMSFSLGKRTDSTTRTDFVTKTTNDEALTARLAWNLDASVWDTTAAKLNKGDFLTVNFGFSGTAQLQYPVAITIRYTPS